MNKQSNRAPGKGPKHHYLFVGVTSALLALLLTLQSPLLAKPLAAPQDLVRGARAVTGIEISGSHGETEFDLVKNAGAGWVRIAGVWWPDVQPTEGRINWDALQWLNTDLLAARRNNLTVVLVVRGVPEWAQAYAGYSCGPIKQDKLSSFASFVAALVNRYSRSPYKVLYWEIGNEPDIDRKLVQPDSRWGCWGDDADDYYGGGAYAAMLRVVYPRVKQVNRAAVVLVGGLALDCDPRPGGVCPTEQRRRPARFLEGILRAGGGAYFDGIAFHSYDYYDIAQPGRYSNSNFNASSAATGPVSISKAAFLRAVLQSYRVYGKVLLNTESALLCKKCDAGNAANAEYELTQAYYAAQVNVMAMATGLRANIWFRLTDWPGTALLKEDLSALPAYTAHQALTQALDGAIYKRTMTIKDTGDAAARGYLFSRINHTVGVVWSGDAQAHTLTLSTAPRAVKDVLGRPVMFTGRQVSLQPPDRLLLYVEW